MKCYVKNYPRPQFVRNNWESLDGLWDFAFDEENTGEKKRWYENFPKGQKILVPFTYETKKSGIGEERRCDCVWYRRTLENEFFAQEGQRRLLHFEGSDFETKVWVNGKLAGSHRGGYARFSFDITELLQDGANELVVKVEDSFDMEQPRGKQRWLDKNFGCWYVQTTGIWKSVWCETVSDIRLEQVKMTPDLENGTLKLVYEITAPEKCLKEYMMVEAVAAFQGETVSRTVTMVSDRHMEVVIPVFQSGVNGMEWGLQLWTPENPQLYDITFRVLHEGVEKDRVASYFAMREIRIEGPNILLNGRPLYQRLILDQGYWKDSHLTPPDEEALIDDIDKIQAMGYNGLRKHQKTEDERFLYWCDVKGMLVWSEMASAYRYSDGAAQEFVKEWMEIVRQNYNHPCIITWTPINESWGISAVETNRTQQHFTEMVYHLTKSLDPCRPVIVNDGWEHTVSDIITLHDYEESGEKFYQRYMECKEEILTTQVYHCDSKSAMANGYAYRGQPIIISEYGGIAFQNEEEGWGYGNKVSTKEEFIRRFDAVTTAIKRLPYCCGFCYTQVTDVQQEINGLMDIDRNFKVEPEVIREINERPTGYWRAADR